MATLTHKTDNKGRLTLPADFASCLVTVERHGDELRVRKAGKVVGRRYTFKQLMAGVTKKNIHAEVSTGVPVGKEIMAIKRGDKRGHSGAIKRGHSGLLPPIFSCPAATVGPAGDCGKCES